METLLLLSVLFGNMAIPIWAARDRSARRSLKKTAVSVLIFNGIYLLAVRYVYPWLQRG